MPCHNKCRVQGHYTNSEHSSFQFLRHPLHRSNATNYQFLYPLCICITCIIVAPPLYICTRTPPPLYTSPLYTPCATSTVCYANYNVHYLKFPHNLRILVTTQNNSCTSHILLHCINCSTVHMG